VTSNNRQRARRASLPNFSPIPLDIAYQFVAHILQSPERGRRDFLKYGREGRLGWWKLTPFDDWINDDEPVASDFLKLCELIEIQLHDGRKVLYLAVRGATNPNVDSTIEVNGETLRVLANDSFGLSRDNLVDIWPSLGGQRRRKEARQQKRAKDLMRQFWPPDGPSEDVTDDMVHQEFMARKIKNPPSVDSIARTRGHRD
jgi:hypothetical protein